MMKAQGRITTLKGDLAAARDLVRENIGGLWGMLPSLPDSPSNESSDRGQFYWRGTILRRLIIAPGCIDGISSGWVRFLDMDAFVGGREPFVEFANTARIARNFATEGFPGDGIRGEQRFDPVVIRRFVKPGEWAGYDEPPDKLAFTVKELVESCALKMFRVNQ